MWFLILTSDIAGLQNEDGSFSGDIWGEVDTRYSFPFCLVIWPLMVLGFSIFASRIYFTKLIPFPIGSLILQYVVSQYYIV
jgi:prenyltransferase beta subunit